MQAQPVAEMAGDGLMHNQFLSELLQIAPVIDALFKAAAEMRRQTVQPHTGQPQLVATKKCSAGVVSAGDSSIDSSKSTALPAGRIRP